MMGSERRSAVISKETATVTAYPFYSLTHPHPHPHTHPHIYIHTAINMATFEWAKDKIMMGSERRSAVISKETATVTAYHEGGHALVALKTGGADPVYKATIMPRGQALGMVTQLPDGDQTSVGVCDVCVCVNVILSVCVCVIFM